MNKRGLPFSRIGLPEACLMSPGLTCRVGDSLPSSVVKQYSVPPAESVAVSCVLRPRRIRLFLHALQRSAKRGQSRVFRVSDAPQTRLSIRFTGSYTRRSPPKFMMVLTMFAGLMPVMWSMGRGSDVMKRIAAPMAGALTRVFCWS